MKYGNQKIYYHRVGTNQSEDVLVVEFEDAQLLMYAIKLYLYEFRQLFLSGLEKMH